MSTSAVCVVFVSSISMFTPRHSGMITAPTVEPMAMADDAGQPMSSTDSDSPKRSTIAATAVANSPPIRLLMMRFSPMKPMPTVRPAFMLLPKPAPNSVPRMVRTMGMTTVTPRLWMPPKNEMSAPIASASPTVP